MPTIRLFAQARERAGAATVRVEGQTVGEAVAALVEQLDPGFGDVLAHSRLWLNAQPIEGDWADIPVANADEIAVVPPVSGGSV